MNNKYLIFFLSALVFTSLPSMAEVVNAEKEYTRCMTLARTQPQAGFDAANGWLGLGGGDAARHCMAVSLLGLKQYGEAAHRLETLALNMRAPKEFKASLLSQSGQAWLLKGDLQKADNVLTAAIKLDPANRDLFVDRAQIAALQKDFSGAVADLNLVLDRKSHNFPVHVEALVFRASAKRQLGQLDAANVDIERALIQNENHLEGLLERGFLRRLKKNLAGARVDWLKVIKLAPKSDTASIARNNLQLMDGPKAN